LFRSSLEFLPKFWILSGNANRACIQVAPRSNLLAEEGKNIQLQRLTFSS
jgi:hypothetical protein